MRILPTYEEPSYEENPEDFARVCATPGVSRTCRSSMLQKFTNDATTQSCCPWPSAISHCFKCLPLDFLHLEILELLWALSLCVVTIVSQRMRRWIVTISDSLVSSLLKVTPGTACTTSSDATVGSWIFYPALNFVMTLEKPSCTGEEKHFFSP